MNEVVCVKLVLYVCVFAELLEYWYARIVGDQGIWWIAGGF